MTNRTHGVAFIAPLLVTVTLGTAGAGSQTPPGATGSDEASVAHPMEIRNPPSLGTLSVGPRGAAGATAGIACATCHDPSHPGALARGEDVPDDFHRGIELRHGDLRCASCHAPEDRTRLRLAHGETIQMGNVVILCGQCHGSQLRDFRKGAHGGGRGFWDRSRGPWIRNACVACHAAHAPAYPVVRPAPPPNDRFLPRPDTPTELQPANGEKSTAHD